MLKSRTTSSDGVPRPMIIMLIIVAVAIFVVAVIFIFGSGPIPPLVGQNKKSGNEHNSAQISNKENAIIDVAVKIPRQESSVIVASLGHGPKCYNPKHLQSVLVKLYKNEECFILKRVISGKESYVNDEEKKKQATLFLAKQDYTIIKCLFDKDKRRIIDDVEYSHGLFELSDEIYKTRDDIKKIEYASQHIMCE